MKIFDTITKLEIFNKLVMEECTGTPDDFSKRLGVSRTSLYDIINELKSLDIQISYSRKRNTFYYSTERTLENYVKIN